MNAPLLWILLPGAASGIILLIRQKERTAITCGSLISVILAWLAWKMPIGQVINLGPFSWKINDALVLLGRQFILENKDRQVLGLIYLAAAFWFAGSYAAKAGNLFVPAGLAVVSLLTAAISVQPFLYAALIIEIAALVSIPILALPGKPPGRGVLRFLIFQTLGTPCILFAGWLLAGIESSPPDNVLVIRALIFLGFGFSFLIALFPFHTWIPMLAEEVHPYTAAFVFFMLPGIVSLLGIGFFDRYSWLRDSEQVFGILRVAGALMVVTGGVWAAFQTHLGRMMGYAVLVDIGLSILILGADPNRFANPQAANSTLSLFFALFLTRGLALGIWSLALSAILIQKPDLRFRTVQGLARKMPVASACLILANLSLAGFPLLAGFPVRIALLEELSRLAPLAALWSLIGSVGLLAGSVRTIAVLVMGAEDKTLQITENKLVGLFLLAGMLLLVVFGLFPRL